MIILLVIDLSWFSRPQVGWLTFPTVTHADHFVPNNYFPIKVILPNLFDQAFIKGTCHIVELNSGLVSVPGISFYNLNINKARGF